MLIHLPDDYLLTKPIMSYVSMSVQLLAARQCVDRTMHICVPHVTIGENQIATQLSSP